MNDIERHVVLVSPEIPWNTGCIGRTCLGADATLHLVEPLGFSIDAKQVKRAGLDYWDRVRLRVWKTLDELLASLAVAESEMMLLSKTGGRPFWQMPRPDRLFLLFGSETQGLPEHVQNRYSHLSYHIPITRDIRSLNLSTAAGIVLYESLRDSQLHHGWPEQNEAGAGKNPDACSNRRPGRGVVGRRK